MSSWSRKSRRSLRYTAASILPVVAVGSALAMRFGRAGVLLAGLLTLPWFAWRYDNETGHFLPLAVLVVFAFVVLALFVFLMAVVLR